MRSARELALLLGLPLAVACDIGHHDDESSAPLGAEFSETADAVTRHVDAHHRAAASAADLNAVEAAEARHREAMGDAMGRMAEAREDMGARAREDGLMGGMHHMGPMEEAARELDAEMGRHQDAMGGADDLDAVRREEDRHRAAMHEAMGRMRMHAGEMMSEDPDAGCPGMHGHMHGGGMGGDRRGMGDGDDRAGGDPPDPSAAVGDPCDADRACPSGGSGTARCLEDWPDGYCAVVDCAAHGHDCPGDAGRDGAEGAKCVLVDEPTCLALCADDGDCRDGHACVVRADAAGDGEVKVCLPR